MKRFLDWYCKLLKGVLTLLIGLMIVPVALQIVSRHTDLIPRYIWTEEVARFCFVWIILIGSTIAVRNGSHFEVDLIPMPKSNKGRGLASLVKHLAMSVMAVIFAWYGIEFARFGFIQNSEMSEINMLFIYISFPIAGISWIMFLLEKLIEDLAIIRSPDHPSKAQQA